VHDQHVSMPAGFSPSSRLQGPHPSSQFWYRFAAGRLPHTLKLNIKLALDMSLNLDLEVCS